MNEWRKKELPALAQRFRLLNDLFTDEEFEDVIAPYVRNLHMTVHSSPQRPEANLGYFEGRLAFISGPDFSRPEKHDSLCGLVLLNLTFINLITEAPFPDVKRMI
jgi:hypothetical protein